jgi:hypothetical protein
LTNNCSNCTYGNKLFGNAEEYDKLSEDYYNKANAELEVKPSLLGLKRINWSLYNAYAGQGRHYMSLALDVKHTLMCSRYPQKQQVSKNYLCGEYRKKDAE